MNVNGFLLKILNRKYKIIKINWQLNFSKIRFKILLNLLNIIYFINKFPLINNNLYFNIIKLNLLN